MNAENVIACCEQMQHLKLKGIWYGSIQDDGKVRIGDSMYRRGTEYLKMQDGKAVEVIQYDGTQKSTPHFLGVFSIEVAELSNLIPKEKK